MSGGNLGMRMTAISVLACAAIAGGVLYSRPDSRRAVDPAYATPQPARAPAPDPFPLTVAAPTPAPTPTPEPEPEPEPYVVKRVLSVREPMRQGDHYWDEAGVPAGQIVITVDLAARVLSVFRGGYEIGTSAVVYGGDDKPTPLGIFPVTQKDADHVSNLYNAPMPYMLRMTDDGISIHGSKVGDAYMTHGCVGVPVDFARRLFAAVKLGDKVIVTNGERLDTGHAITAA